MSLYCLNNVTKSARLAALLLAGTAPAAAGQSCLDLDVKGCGVINASQFTAMIQLVGLGGASQADFDQDGDTDGDDLAFFFANFSGCTIPGTPTTSFPEPGSLKFRLTDVSSAAATQAGLREFEVLAVLGSPDDRVVSVTSASLDCVDGSCFVGMPQPGITQGSYLAIGNRLGDPDYSPPIAFFGINDAFRAGTAIDIPAGWATDIFSMSTGGLGGDPGNQNGVLLLQLVVPVGETPVLDLRVAHVEGQTLFVTPAEISVPAERCLADVNVDGMLNGLDFGAWLGAFNIQSPAADQNGDGAINGLDFGAWLSNFNAGCD